MVSDVRLFFWGGEEILITVYFGCRIGLRTTRDRPAGDTQKIREEAAVEERWQNLKNRTFSIRLARKKAVRSVGRTAYICFVSFPKCFLIQNAANQLIAAFCGERGIRTPGTVTRTTV